MSTNKIIFSSTVLHEIYNYVLNIIPDKFFSTDDFILGYYSQKFAISGYNFVLESGEVSNCEYLYIRSLDFEDREPCIMALGKRVRMFEPGIGEYTYDKEFIMNKFLEMDTSHFIVFFNSRILARNECYVPSEVTKDVLFNMSTLLEQKELQAFIFLSELKNAVNYISINMQV